MTRVIGAGLLVMAVSACVASPDPAPQPTIEYITVAPTLSPTPSPPPRPTATPTATASPRPASQMSSDTVTAQDDVLTQPGAYSEQCGPYPYAVSRWWGEVAKYGWDPCTALWVISAESGGLNVYNFEGSGACGVMQLLPCEFPDDGASNIARGYSKYLAAGWSPWAVMN